MIKTYGTILLIVGIFFAAWWFEGLDVLFYWLLRIAIIVIIVISAGLFCKKFTVEGNGDYREIPKKKER